MQIQLASNGSLLPNNERHGKDATSESDKRLNNESSKKEFRSGTFDYLDTFILDREESLIHIAAHEFWLLWQRLYKEPFSDKHADLYAISKQRV